MKIFLNKKKHLNLAHHAAVKAIVVPVKVYRVRFQNAGLNRNFYLIFKLL
jgi:hypothetical protein